MFVVAVAPAVMAARPAPPSYPQWWIDSALRQRTCEQCGAISVGNEFCLGVFETRRRAEACLLGLYVAASNDVGGGCDQVVARFNFAVVCGRQPRRLRAACSWQPVAASSSAGVGSGQSWRGKSSTAAGSPAPASIQEWEAKLLDDMEDSDDTAHSSAASLPPLMPITTAGPPDSALQPAAGDADSQPPPPLTATPDDDDLRPHPFVLSLQALNALPHIAGIGGKVGFVKMRELRQSALAQDLWVLDLTHGG